MPQSHSSLPSTASLDSVAEGGRKRRASIDTSNRHLPVVETNVAEQSRDALGDKMINDYVLTTTLGRGSFGKVKLGVNDLNQTFAIKILKKTRLTKLNVNGESALADVQREIAIMKKLDHPNVVKLFEVIDDPECPKLFLVMEFVTKGCVIQLKPEDGTSTPIPQPLARSYFIDMMNGMQYLHFNKIIHNDVKPENLLVDESSTLKLADFGVGRMFEGNDDRIEVTPGTVSFAAPETLEGTSFAGRPADVWSCGVTLYAMLFGKLPFFSTQYDDLVQKIRTETVSYPLSAPHWAVNLLQRIFNRDPTQRATIPEIMDHPWVRAMPGSPKAPTPFINAKSVIVSDLDISRAFTKGQYKNAKKIAAAATLSVIMRKRANTARMTVERKRGNSVTSPGETSPQLLCPAPPPISVIDLDAGDHSPSEISTTNGQSKLLSVSSALSPTTPTTPDYSAGVSPSGKPPLPPRNRRSSRPGEDRKFNLDLENSPQPPEPLKSPINPEDLISPMSRGAESYQTTSQSARSSITEFDLSPSGALPSPAFSMNPNQNVDSHVVPIPIIVAPDLSSPEMLTSEIEKPAKIKKKKKRSSVAGSAASSQQRDTDSPLSFLPESNPGSPQASSYSGNPDSPKSAYQTQLAEEAKKLLLKQIRKQLREKAAALAAARSTPTLPPYSPGGGGLNDSYSLEIDSAFSIDAQPSPRLPASGRTTPSGRSTPKIPKSGRSTPMSITGRATPLLESGRATPVTGERERRSSRKLTKTKTLAELVAEVAGGTPQSPSNDESRFSVAFSSGEGSSSARNSLSAPHVAAAASYMSSEASGTECHSTQSPPISGLPPPPLHIDTTTTSQSQGSDQTPSPSNLHLELNQSAVHQMLSGTPKKRKPSSASKQRRSISAWSDVGFNGDVSESPASSDLQTPTNNGHNDSTPTIYDPASSSTTTGSLTMDTQGSSQQLFSLSPSNSAARITKKTRSNSSKSGEKKKKQHLSNLELDSLENQNQPQVGQHMSTVGPSPRLTLDDVVS